VDRAGSGYLCLTRPQSLAKWCEMMWMKWLPLAGAAIALSAGVPGPGTLSADPVETAASKGGGQDTVSVCVVRDGELIEVAAAVDPQTGDTVVDGRPYREAFPADAPHYLAAAEWAARGEWVVHERRRYVSYGTPRILRAADLVRVGEFRGIPLFARRAEGGFRSVYLPTRPGCEFQLFHYNATVGEVRG
jgi:hypothetical protein